MTNIENRYDMTYTVASSTIDAKSRLTPFAIVQIAQDLAASHYGLNGLSIPHLMKKGYTWIVARQRFVINEYPLWLDELSLSTWTKTPKGVFSFRDYEIIYTQNGRRYSNQTPSIPCIQATSSWMIIDINEGKPVKPDQTFLGKLIPQTYDSIPSIFPKINLPEIWDMDVTVKPTILDIDMNGHVNNSVYIRWILSNIPQTVYQGKLICTLDIHYSSSAMEHEELICRASIAENDTCIHSIIRKKDSSEVFRAKTQWCPEQELSRELVLV